MDKIPNDPTSTTPNLAYRVKVIVSAVVVYVKFYIYMSNIYKIKI